jgi:hypothetical protein
MWITEWWYDSDFPEMDESHNTVYCLSIVGATSAHNGASSENPLLNSRKIGNAL